MYNHKHNPDVIFQDLSCIFESNQISVILGRSGFGKTTLLKLICGLLNPCADNALDNDENKILIAGHTPKEATFQRLIGYLPQESQPAPWRTAYKNLFLALEMAGIPRSNRSSIIKRTLSRLGLTSLSNRYPHQLSGGQRRRIAIAMILAAGPSFLLLDEPFKGLDAITQAEIYRFLLEIWENRSNDGVWTTLHKGHKQSMIIVTHDLQEATLLADKIFVMVDRPVKYLKKVDNPLSKDRSPETIERLRFHPKFQKVAEKLRGLL